MNLKDLQNDFVDAFFGAEIDVDKYIISDDSLTAKQRFGIYKGSVHGVLTQALADMYPVCKELVGDKFFDHVTSKFINQNPPRSAFFADFGEGFSDFLANFEAAKSVAYLADTARLEWLRHTAWNSKNQEPSDFTTLGNYSEEQQLAMSFSLPETASLLQADYQVEQLWQAHQEANDLDLEKIDLFKHLNLLVWRTDYTIYMQELSTQQIDFLHAVQQNMPLSALAEQFTEHLADLLSTALGNGWIRSFHLA
ncbi:MAG: DUF2063 domain-containing protein [Aquificaceae bacterium]|nr:MAG: DUF2063 domain-containing protein [Aquificaceae bacterium]